MPAPINAILGFSLFTDASAEQDFPVPVDSSWSFVLTRLSVYHFESTHSYWPMRFLISRTSPEAVANFPENNPTQGLP
jgi:hypothetical protein